MDHPFQSSLTDSNICGKCKYNAIMHTNMATCETCPNIGNVEMFAGMAMCSICISKEMKATVEYQSDDKQEVRLAEYRNEELKRIQSIDYHVQVREDIFNAETVAIVEIKNIIDSDDNIKNKPYALAKMLEERFLHFKQVIFDLGKEQIEKQNQQRAIHTYLHTLADKLSLEEREKLKLQDVNYQPTAPKLTSKSPIPKKKTFDKAKLAKYAGECGLPLATFQMLCVQRNLTPELMAAVFTKVTTQVANKE